MGLSGIQRVADARHPLQRDSNADIRIKQKVFQAQSGKNEGLANHDGGKLSSYHRLLFNQPDGRD